MIRGEYRIIKVIEDNIQFDSHYIGSTRRYTSKEFGNIEVICTSKTKKLGRYNTKFLVFEPVIPVEGQFKIQFVFMETDDIKEVSDIIRKEYGHIKNY